jgi:heptosyltransferase III
VTALDDRIHAFATQEVDLSAHTHATSRALAIAGVSTPCSSWTEATRVCVSPAPKHASDAADLLARYGVANSFIAIHPGSGADVKLWPIGRWREIARRLIDRGHSIVVTGSQAESDMTGSIVNGLPGAVSIAGQTNLDILIALFARAELVAGPDCGPLHLAVACQTPTVHLFGPSDSARFGPWGPPGKHQVVSAGWTCARCGDLSRSRQTGCGCMLAIAVDPVYGSIIEMVDKHAAL